MHAERWLLTSPFTNTCFPFARLFEQDGMADWRPARDVPLFRAAVSQGLGGAPIVTPARTPAQGGAERSAAVATPARGLGGSLPVPATPATAAAPGASTRGAAAGA